MDFQSIYGQAIGRLFRRQPTKKGLSKKGSLSFLESGQIQRGFGLENQQIGLKFIKVSYKGPNWIKECFKDGFQLRFQAISFGCGLFGHNFPEVVSNYCQAKVDLYFKYPPHFHSIKAIVAFQLTKY